MTRYERIVRVVFVAHGIVTLAAAVVLAVVPAAVPATVGIDLGPRDALVSYLLAAAEFAIALLSIGAARLADAPAIRLIALSFAAFHASTAILETVYLATFGITPVLVVNIIVRIVVAVVFLLIGIRATGDGSAGVGA